MVAEWIEPIHDALAQAAHSAPGAQAALLPGVGAQIGAGMIASVAATVFVTGALKGIVGFGLSTGSVVVFSLHRLGPSVVDRN